MTLGRRIAAGIGIVIMVLTGGCSLRLLIGTHPGEFLGYVVVIGGIPFFIGLVIFWLAVFAGRR